MGASASTNTKNNINEILGYNADEIFKQNPITENLPKQIQKIIVKYFDFLDLSWRNNKDVTLFKEFMQMKHDMPLFRVEEFLQIIKEVIKSYGKKIYKLNSDDLIKIHNQIFLVYKQEYSKLVKKNKPDNQEIHLLNELLGYNFFTKIFENSITQSFFDSTFELVEESFKLLKLSWRDRQDVATFKEILNIKRELKEMPYDDFIQKVGRRVEGKKLKLWESDDRIKLKEILLIEYGKNKRTSNRNTRTRKENQDEDEENRNSGYPPELEGLSEEELQELYNSGQIGGSRKKKKNRTTRRK